MAADMPSNRLQAPGCTVKKMCKDPRSIMQAKRESYDASATCNKAKEGSRSTLARKKGLSEGRQVSENESCQVRNL
jgi:hypothetical protein